MTLSVIVPAYNAQETLPFLIDSLSDQSFDDFEVIVVDDCSSDNTSLLVETSSFNLVKLRKNHGPAFCRNIGVLHSSGDMLVFTDSDCFADRLWLEKINNQFQQNNIDALMGRLVLMPSSYLGDSISALGFPAGGSLGFESVWKVDDHGYTNSLSSCNCAVRREVFEAIGGFDETFPYAGGEDSFFAYSLVRAGYKIRYCPDVVAWHGPRDSLKDFIIWQFKRGISSYMFSQKVSNRKSFLSLRLWSWGNVIKYNLRDKKLPLITMLLCMSILLQSAGAVYAKLKETG